MSRDPRIARVSIIWLLLDPRKGLQDQTMYPHGQALYPDVHILDPDLSTDGALRVEIASSLV